MNLIRNPNGTGYYGHIDYIWTSVWEKSLRFKFVDDVIPPIEQVYQRYGVCSALMVRPERISDYGQLDHCYDYLYGVKIEDILKYIDETTGYKGAKRLAELRNGSYSSVLDEPIKVEPQEWTPKMIESMDWDMFCISYYTFLASENDFHSDAWKALSSILRILSSNQLLSSLLEKSGRYDESSISDFWSTIRNGLYEKVFLDLNESTCYTALNSLLMLKSFFSKGAYQPLEHRCCDFFDKIARDRIDAACSKTYTVRELSVFDVEVLFFYKDYFELSSAHQETKEYVYKSVFNLLCKKGDLILETHDLIGADDVYTNAIKYALSAKEKDEIINKRSDIAPLVNIAREKDAHDRALLALQREKESESRKRREKIIVAFLAITLVVSLLSTIIFGVLTLLGKYSFTKLALLLSGGVLLVVVIVIILDYIIDRIRH